MPSDMKAVKAVPLYDSDRETIDLGVYNPYTREFMRYRKPIGAIVTLPKMGKNTQERKAILGFHGKSWLRNTLPILRSPKPEKLGGMNRYLTDKEKYAIRQGILCYLENDAAEIMPRGDEDE